MRSNRSLLAAAATVVMVGLTGCSATVTGSPAPTGGSAALATSAPAAAATTGDPVAWTDKVCGSLLPFVKAASTEPQFNKNDPGDAVKALSNYLGGAVSSIDQALTGLDAAGPAPVTDGDAIVAKLKQTLTTVRASFNQAKTAIDKVDPNNVAQIATALPEALAPLQSLSSLQDPTNDLKSNPALEAAAAKAPNCQEVNKLG